MPSRKVIPLVVLLLACAQQTPPPPTQAAARKYVMVMGANHAGRQSVTTNGKQTTVDFEFNDRGRGPKTHTVFTLDERGIPIAEATTGNDYLKVPVDERLTNSGGAL